MPRTLALALLTLCFCAVASPQPLLIGRLVDVSRRPGVPVDGAKVTVLDTRQETVTKADGLFQFPLPPGVRLRVTDRGRGREPPRLPATQRYADRPRTRGEARGGGT